MWHGGYVLTAKSSSLENISPQVLRRVAKELSDLATSAMDGIKIIVNEEDITDIQALIDGPGMPLTPDVRSHSTEGTPYHGGVFRVKLVLSNDFPAAPPKGYFITKIFHPNVSKAGEICVNTLKKDWKSDYGVGHVLTVVKCLLIHPNAESALNEEAGKLLLEKYMQFLIIEGAICVFLCLIHAYGSMIAVVTPRYEDYARHAKMMTDIHAKPATKEPSAEEVCPQQSVADC
jgi:ubiquitin-conjugating enzyme E2 S